MRHVHRHDGKSLHPVQATPLAFRPTWRPSGEEADSLRATYDHRDFPLGELAAAKRRSGLSVSVCLPARNEQATVGRAAATLVRDLVFAHDIVDEVIVLDDGSVDGTAEVAARAGAGVVSVPDILPDVPTRGGKGNVLWRSLFVSTGDIVCWIDADIRNFDSYFVSGLLGPLLADPGIGFVKGFYARPLGDDPTGGGRVTELVARPLIANLFPHASGIVQPLAGATAGRRHILDSLPFVAGWGVEFALLLDVIERYGPGIIGQTNLGELRHRNHPLHKLAVQAAAILTVALDRAGLKRASVCELPSYGPEIAGATAIEIIELPPANSLPAYSARFPARTRSA
jgi:glucosyl-3-phosphoglycerate synthase